MPRTAWRYLVNFLIMSSISFVSALDLAKIRATSLNEKTLLKIKETQVVRTLLTLVVLAVLPHSFANAEFVLDDVGMLTPSFFMPNTIETSDDFGNMYSIDRSIAGGGATGGFATQFVAAGETFDIVYDFTPVPVQSPSSTFALGYYAQNFRIEGVDTDPNDGFELDVSITRGNGLSESLSLGAVNDAATDPIFFDFTDFANVGILNDLSQLKLSFTNLSIVGDSSINFENFSLVANPEPTSAASFGLLGLIGLVCSTRRRKK